MKIVDLSTLVYTTDRTSARHAAAKTWLDRAMSSTETIGIPIAVARGYVRTPDHPRMRGNT